VNNTLVHLFVSRRVGPGRTLSANVESAYDWEGEQWTAPINVSYGQVMRIGRQVVNVQGGMARYASGPDLWPAGKLYRFRVEAFDDAGPIGEGEHTRAIVATERLLGGAAKRARPAAASGHGEQRPDQR
jgi:hypothetical protein